MRCAFAPRLSWLWRFVPRALLVHGAHVDDRLLSVLVPVVFLLQHLLRLQVLVDMRRLLHITVGRHGDFELASFDSCMLETINRVGSMPVELSVLVQHLDRNGFAGNNWMPAASSGDAGGVQWRTSTTLSSFDAS